jgi:hypothetical protein
MSARIFIDKPSIQSPRASRSTARASPEVDVQGGRPTAGRRARSYRYIADQKSGDTSGQGVSAFGARWYAVNPAGGRLGGGY